MRASDSPEYTKDGWFSLTPCQRYLFNSYSVQTYPIIYFSYISFFFSYKKCSYNNMFWILFIVWNSLFIWLLKWLLDKFKLLWSWLQLKGSKIIFLMLPIRRKYKFVFLTILKKFLNFFDFGLKTFDLNFISKLDNPLNTNWLLCLIILN